VAVVANTGVTRHGLMGVSLHERGALVDIHRPFAGAALPYSADTDALVICGGEQSALADATYSYLPARCSLMREMTIAAKPVLGICLGARHWCNLHHRHRAGV
jgi:GMP synthase (glutamine-hydrolysing)